MAPHSPTKAADGVNSLRGSDCKDHSEADCDRDEAGTLTFKHRIALSAGLMASEAMGVFSNLNEMPLQQALGSPVYLLTVPGAVSASVALGLVPLMGWLADGGSTPEHRKKPATIVAFYVGFLGLCLNLSAAILPTVKTAVSNHTTLNSSGINDPSNDASGLRPTNTVLPDSQATPLGLEIMSFSGTDWSNESEVTTTIDDAGISLSPLFSEVFGLPLPVVLSMGGFVFMDLGFDLTNSAVKGLMLTHSAPADHVSLLVTGVFMSALGGCSTSFSGLVDLGSVFPDVDPVCSQAIVQLSIIVILCVICCTSSVLSASRVCPPDDRFHYDRHSEEVQQSVDGTENSRRSSMAFLREVQEDMFLASMTPAEAEAIMSSSTQLERSYSGFSVSTTEEIPLLLAENRYESIPEEAEATKPAAKDNFLSNRKFKLFILWLAAFFSGCSIFTFNVTIADYIGKVIFGGNPHAEADSEEYSLYQQGMQTAALCVLILNTAYVIAALCQRRVLNAISPKAEYAMASVTLMLLLLATRQSGNLWVVYPTSCVVGLNRAALFTVPFVLATELCHLPQNEKCLKAQGRKPDEERSQFGSTMALMTSSTPSAYLLINAIIGPLVDATGDPSAPLMMALVCSLLAALIVCCYKT